MVKEEAPLERGHRVGDLYRCEGPKTLVFQLWGRRLGSAPGSGDGRSNVDVFLRVLFCLLGSRKPLKRIVLSLSYLANFALYIYFYYLITFIICIYVF